MYHHQVDKKYKQVLGQSDDGLSGRNMVLNQQWNKHFLSGWTEHFGIQKPTNASKLSLYCDA
jgi:hypothetical protein